MIEKTSEEYTAIVLAVKHKIFEALDWSMIKGENTVVFDVKGGLAKEMVTERL